MNKEEIKIITLGDIFRNLETEEQAFEFLKYIKNLQQENQKYKEVIDKTIETLEKGITFCENDSQGIYDKCNIAINREKKILDILNEATNNE